MENGEFMIAYRYFLFSVFASVLFSCVCSQVFGQSKTVKPTEVTFKTEDRIKIYGEIYKSPKGKNAPLILLFHQGSGDSRGEYGSYIAPRLAKRGYNVLAIDQRSGGDRFGSPNRTAAALNGRKFSFCDAYNDLKAALMYVKRDGYSGKRIAWGSSYSASLVFRLASEYPNDLAGILAFSPAGGEPMADCKADLYVAQLKIPALAFRPASEMEMATVKQQVSLFEKHNVETYVSKNGVHGSSTLHPERVTGGIEEHWQKVFSFLEDKLTPMNKK
jgi:dienelactone hydrolase